MEAQLQALNAKHNKSHSNNKSINHEQNHEQNKQPIICKEDWVNWARAWGLTNYLIGDN